MPWTNNGFYIKRKSIEPTNNWLPNTISNIWAVVSTECFSVDIKIQNNWRIKFRGNQWNIFGTMGVLLLFVPSLVPLAGRGTKHKLLKKTARIYLGQNEMLISTKYYVSRTYYDSTTTTSSYYSRVLLYSRELLVAKRDRSEIKKILTDQDRALNISSYSATIFIYQTSVRHLEFWIEVYFHHTRLIDMFLGASQY